MPGTLAATLVGAALLAATGCSLGGSAGYREVSDDGRLTCLGWQAPDLTGRPRTRVRAGEMLTPP